MKYKALFLDVDGTTVAHGEGNLPTERVTRAIAMCRKNGVFVCLATSRPLSSVRRVIEHLDLAEYHVISSGAQIYDGTTKKIIVEKSIPKSCVMHIFDVAKKYNVHVKFFDGVTDSHFDGVHIPEKIVDAYFPELEPKILKNTSCAQFH